MSSMLIVLGVLTMAIAATFLGRKWYGPVRWQTHPIVRGERERTRVVLVTGATGFIGRHLCRRLIEEGDQVLVLSRNAERARDLFGPHVVIHTCLDAIPSSCRIDCVMNLAGEPIFARPWTVRRRRQLIESRLGVTRSLVDFMARLEQKPTVFISMSAVGYYGVRQDQELTEADRGQTIFQSQLCQLWELAAQRAEALGIRVCRLRLGMVLGIDGGALPRLAMAARMRLRTVLGSGGQWISWIHIEDVLRLIEYCRERESLSGAINATAPTPVSQIEFAGALSARFGRSLQVRAPKWLLCRMLGEMAQLLVDGQRVLPFKARCAGFQFRYAQIDAAVAALFGPRRSHEPAEIYYDTLCPICDAEMSHYVGLAKRQGLPWKFLDVAARVELMAQRGLDLGTARKRVYVLTQSGELVSGMDAFQLIWRGLPRWRVLARVLRMPLVRQCSAAAYDLVLAPLIWRWNQKRREGGARCPVASQPSQVGAPDDALATGITRRSAR